ncbi:MAG: AAA family ATPase [Rhizobacter sp.]|nr:AAA family ATPase [Rhizobacter sp.]
MKLTEFNVRMFRSVIDSGWVTLDDIAVIVGKNESGKTSLLKALWKLKPFKKEPYSLDREWPRGKRKERDDKFEVVRARFVFNEQEQAALALVDPQWAGTTSALIGRRYDGTYSVVYEPKGNVPQKRSGKSACLSLDASVKGITAGKAEPLVGALNAVVQQSKEKLEAAAEDVGAIKAALAEAKAQLVEMATQQASPELAQTLGVECDRLAKKQDNSPWTDAWNLVLKWMPTFIYMDDWLAFHGTAHLDQVKQRKDQGQATEEDKTIEMIMEMAGLDLAEEVTKGAQKDREQRILDMNDASQTLTNDIAARWSQKKYEVQFQADGYHFITFVKDEDTRALVPLEERSKGFQWFFSFDMKFMYETDGEFRDAVILLDEPGLHLHAAAQRDLLGRMKEYAKANQVIYTTHLPFMIDMNRLDNIWVAEEKRGEGTKVHDEWATADKDARFTLQAALGLSWAQSLFIGERNLVVEGVTDFWFLSTVSTMFKEAAEVGLDDSIVITPAGGASKAAYLATLMLGQELKVATLLDSDTEGENARKQLINNWLMKDGDVLMLGSVIGKPDAIELEDLFEQDSYLRATAEAYAKEIGGAKVAIKLPAGAGSIVDRLTTFFEKKGVKFNKGRVAKVIMKDLSKQKFAELPQETRDRFAKVFEAVNGIAARWAAAAK